MLVFFNWIGFGMLSVSFALGFGLGALFGIPEGGAMLLGGLLALLADALYRHLWFRNSGSRKYFMPKYGGHIIFIPVWILGLIWMFMGLLKTR